MKARLAKKIAKELMRYKEASKIGRLRHSIPQQYKAMHVYARTHEVWMLDECEYYNKLSKRKCKSNQRKNRILKRMARLLCRLANYINRR